jgi:hypothetical protein
MRQLDLKQLAAKVSVEHGIRIDPDDPMMAVVTLNRVVLEQAANEILEQVRSATVEFQQAANSVQGRAGKAVAEQVRACVAALRHDFLNDVGKPHSQLREGLEPSSRANARPVVYVWVAVGLFAGTVLFGCGFWLGTLLR